MLYAHRGQGGHLHPGTRHRAAEHPPRSEQLCKVLSDLKNAGHEIILVSSGAIGMGVGKLSTCPSGPADMPTKQAAAAVGQCELMYTYDKLFTEYNHTVAQVLLTGEDVEHEDRRAELPQHPDPAAGAGRAADHQRERHRCHRGDQRHRRQRHAWAPSWPLRCRRICWCC